MKAMSIQRFGGPRSFRNGDGAPRAGAEPVASARGRVFGHPGGLQSPRRRQLGWHPAARGVRVGRGGNGGRPSAQVGGFTAGDEVFYSPNIGSALGSYAEFNVADAAVVARKPDNLSMQESVIEGALSPGERS